MIDYVCLHVCMYACMYVCMYVSLYRSGCMKLLLGCAGGVKLYLEPDQRLIRAKIESEWVKSSREA